VSCVSQKNRIYDCSQQKLKGLNGVPKIFFKRNYPKIETKALGFSKRCNSDEMADEMAETFAQPGFANIIN